jgi:hypothetical protein
MDLDDAKLGNFFSRPIKIREIEWGTGANLFNEFDPWSLYLNNPRVINRITNFHLMKAVLNIKIVINGNGFQYGRAIAAYNPLEPFDDFTTNRSLVRQDVVAASQRPHIYLDPTTSTGGTLKLPFFNYRNYTNVADAAWSELGRMCIRSINPLKHANGATDQVTVSVFAWIEDVGLSVLTSVDADTLTAQSGREVDIANKDGIVSGPATAIAKAAGALKSIPAIAPFATATEAGAGVVAKVAKSLGYCRPPVTANPEPFKPVPASSLAMATVPDGTQKLTVDDKQELSVDPRIAGLSPTDPLNIKSIAQRESYLTSFTWAIGTAPETLLWNCRIDPCLFATDGLTPLGYHFPAMAMAALPFKYWTGSIKFRFQVVASAFHKGRLKIVYDPNYLESNEYNTNYLEIVDIAEKSDFTIEFGNGQTESWLTHCRPGITSTTELYSTTAYSAKEAGNGVVGVYIVNELTTPNSTVNNDVEVNVFVSAGDDFEVAVPDDHFQRFVFKPQSGEEAEIIPESMNTSEPSAPQQTESTVVGVGDTNHELLAKVFIGEAISSFRTLLKRYNLHSNLGWLADTNYNMLSGRRSMFPYLRGNVAGAVDTTSTLASYNYCNTVLLHWVTYAFSGWRGSIRWKIIPHGFFDTSKPTVYYIQRAPLGEIEFERDVLGIPSPANSSQLAKTVVIQPRLTNLPGQLNIPSGVRGMLYQDWGINPTAEFEVPYYSPFRFTPGKQENMTGIGVYEEAWDYRIVTDGATSTNFNLYCAAGEDFTPFFFTGLPVMYYEDAPPLAEGET